MPQTLSARYSRTEPTFALLAPHPPRAAQPPNMLLGSSNARSRASGRPDRAIPDARPRVSTVIPSSCRIIPLAYVPRLTSGRTPSSTQSRTEMGHGSLPAYQRSHVDHKAFTAGSQRSSDDVVHCQPHHAGSRGTFGHFNLSSRNVIGQTTSKLFDTFKVRSCLVCEALESHTYDDGSTTTALSDAIAN